MAKRPLSILFYAINGQGLGHLSRLTAIARQTRSLLEAMNVPHDLRIITTSEASEVVRDFPVYKIPSKTLLAGSPAADDYVAQSRFFVTNLVALLRPDLLVLDTQPEGAFHEFLMLRDYATKTVFLDRHRDDRVRNARLQQNVMALYDLILVPDHTDELRYPLPAKLACRRHFTGPIHGFRPEKAHSSREIRRQLGVPEGAKLIYVSAGGGGDSQAEAQLNQLLDVLQERRDTFLLVGYGPLYRGNQRYGPRMIAYNGSDISRFFPAVDLAISAAGYNSYEELLAAGVPALFYAQEKGMDRQDERIEQGMVHGFHGQLTSFDPALIRHQVDIGLDDAFSEQIALALAQRPISQGALTAAYQLLTLHSSLTRSPVDRIALQHAACCARDWADQGDFARRYRFCHLLLSGDPAAQREAYDEALVSWRQEHSLIQLTMAEQIKHLLRAADHLNLSHEGLVAFIRRCQTAVPSWSPDHMTELLLDWLQALVGAKMPESVAELMGLLTARVKKTDLAAVCRELLQHQPLEPHKLVQLLTEDTSRALLDLNRFEALLDRDQEAVGEAYATTQA